MRKFTGWGRIVIGILLGAFTVFQMYTEATIPLPPYVQNSIHLLFAFSLVLIMYPPFKGKEQRKYFIIDLVLCLAVATFTLRLASTGSDRIPTTQIARPNVRDIIFALLLIIMTIETARRVVGWPLVIVALVFIVYSFAGPIIPGVLSHEGIKPVYFVVSNYMTELGSMGSMTSLSAGMIFAVVAFGALMFYLGSGELLIKLAISLAGKFRGGPAKVAICGSALFGTISGSAVANVASVGVFTIPMMKRLGYKPEFAGAVEACASTGGMVMPPVMGVAAFIMAEFLGIPYNKLILYAAIPAIFYYLTLFIQVHLEAVKEDLKPMPAEEIAAAKKIPLVDWVLVLPLVVFIYLLVGKQMDVTTSAFYSSVSTWVAFIIHELVAKRRVNYKKLVLSIEQPARQMLGLAIPIATMGVLVYSIDVSGLASKISTVLVELAGNNIWLLMFFTMLASLILGMGLPATPCYIFLAILAAPALVQMGILPLAAHMFIFYFGIISAITPPVCVASYVAAGIAGADSMKVAVQGTKLGISGFIVPFMFAISPSLLLQNASVFTILLDSISLLIAGFGLAIAVEGFLIQRVSVPWRFISAIAAALLIYPGPVNDVIGFIMLAALFAVQILAARRMKVPVPAK